MIGDEDMPLDGCTGLDANVPGTVVRAPGLPVVDTGVGRCADGSG
jgi:hypothetical protein